MISVVMITRNEEKAIAVVVGDIKKVVPEAEILIVDSSEDRTPEIAESLGVKVIRQYPPRGYNPAMYLALKSAKGEVIVTLDCDNTYPVEQIPILVNRILKDNYDVVDTSRLKTKPDKMPWINYLANFGFALLASILFCRRITDLHSGMRAYRKKIIDKIEFDVAGTALPAELLLKTIRLGYRVDTVFIDYKERIGSSKLQPLSGAWWTLKKILNNRFKK